jgi:hypothetical protein
MSKSNQKSRSNPLAFLNMAREYYQAAEELAASKSRIQNARYFLYFHATELLLKAYLRARGVKSEGHKISDLYKECRDAGLTINSEDKYGLHNIVSLLESGNKGMGFRYFTMKSGSIPEMGWTSEVVGQLMQAVTEVVDANGDSTKPGPAAKLTMTLGKPVPKD